MSGLFGTSRGPSPTALDNSVLSRAGQSSTILNVEKPQAQAPASEVIDSLNSAIARRRDSGDSNSADELEKQRDDYMKRMGMRR